MHVTIPEDTIKEKDSVAYTIGAIYVFPFLGNTYLGETEGYMLIPDGQGVLVYLNDKEKRITTPYIQPVYGEKRGVSPTLLADYSTPIESVIAPIYGMVHTREAMGFLGVIGGGDYAADILAYPNGVRTNFNWITARFKYNLLYKQPLGPNSAAVSKRMGARDFDIQLHFLLVEGKDANFCGLASAYRKWLYDNGCLNNADSGRNYDFRVDFLGAEKEKALIGKKDVIMTTFAQAGEIVDTLLENDIDGLSVCYRGWQRDGLTAGLPLVAYRHTDY